MILWMRILSRAWPGNTSVLCSVGWGQSLSCILWYLSWARKSRKALFMCFVLPCFSMWTLFFFIYVAKVGFFMVISAYSDFLYGISFSKDNVTTSEGTHYRPKAQLQKLYSHFCCILLTKTAYEPGKTDAKEKFHI